MGGFGSGGRRSGAGRKKKPTHLRGIDGGAGRRGGEGGDEPPAPLPGDASIVLPPDDLGPDERRVWDAWAPLAHQERTLGASTLSSFVLLCELEVDRRALRSRYITQRSAAGDVKPLLYMGSEEEMAARREHRALSKDIKAMLKDFKIAPFGKELTSAGGRQVDEDPLDQFTRRG